MEQSQYLALGHHIVSNNELPKGVAAKTIILRKTVLSCLQKTVFYVPPSCVLCASRSPAQSRQS